MNRMNTTLLLSFLFWGQFINALEALNYKFGLNDVSVLLPLPEMSEINLLLNPQSKKNLGALLPETAYKFLPVLSPLIDHQTNYHSHLKVIAIRFDPCYQEGFTPLDCQAQIRLVWQPLHSYKNQTSTIDAAIHTFYNLTSSDWKSLLVDLQNLPQAEKSLPLQIHPLILNQGYNGPYWKALKSIILNYAGEKNLVRATVMTVRMDRVWGFQGIDFTDDSWKQIEIPTLKSPNSPHAKVINISVFFEPESLLNLKEFKGGITLLEPHNKQWFRLLSDSAKYIETQTEDSIREALSVAYKAENPLIHNPGTIDCASCHIAQAIRYWGESHRPSWTFSEAYINNEFNLTNTSVNPWMTNKLRAFGYFNRDVSISQRVIHESAEVVKKIGK